MSPKQLCKSLNAELNGGKAHFTLFKFKYIKAAQIVNFQFVRFFLFIHEHLNLSLLDEFNSVAIAFTSFFKKEISWSIYREFYVLCNYLELLRIGKKKQEEGPDFAMMLTCYLTVSSLDYTRDFGNLSLVTLAELNSAIQHKHQGQFTSKHAQYTYN